MKLTVIVTVYNEEKTILEAIKQAKALALDKQIIVVDNCSTDGTKEILKKLDDPSLEIIFQPQNYGYGQSVKTGVSLAGGEFVFVHNTDLEYDIECVYKMLDIAEKENLDAVFGSRLYEKKHIFSIIKARPYYLGTLITTFLINLLYRREFTDIIGARFYRASVFKKIEVDSTKIGFDFEVVSRFCKAGLKIKEVPVSYTPRTSRQGKKVKAMDIIPAVMTILKVKFLDKKRGVV